MGCLGCITKRPDIATQLTPILVIPLFLFSNFFVSNNAIPKWIRWIQYIDAFYYGSEALCIWEFKNQLSADGVDSGNAFLEGFEMKSDNLMRDLYALLALFVGFRMIAIIML